MPISSRHLRPLFLVALPVVVAAVLVCLAIINIAMVRTWRGEPEDGVLWGLEAPGSRNVVAREVYAPGAGAKAGIQAGDLLLRIGDKDITSERDVQASLRGVKEGQALTYTITNPAAGTLGEKHVTPTFQLSPTPPHGLYYSLAIVGIFSLIVGASVRLRRPNDSATLHFFWLTVAFMGVLAFTMSGRLNRLDYFFYWSDAIAMLALPPLFLHFAFVFPERPNPWIRTDAGRTIMPAVYFPAFLLGGSRAIVLARGAHGPQATHLLEKLEKFDLLYLSACLLGGLALLILTLSRLRSVTARRQLRWIVWGSAVGAVPCITIYLLPFVFGKPPKYAEYSAVLLGCIPLAFASALVRYRLMDVEVIIKKVLAVGAAVCGLAAIYGGTLQLVSMFAGTDEGQSRVWALLATLVVALVTPWLWKAIQTALDRLYYRDRYDYRRALVGFARELSSDLDLQRLSKTLVTRVQETLMVDRLALLLADPADEDGDFVAISSAGFHSGPPPAIARKSGLATRIAAGHTIVIDDPVPARRLSGDDATIWRNAGLFCFVPCISKGTAIGVIAVGRRPEDEPLSSEDMTLLGAVAGQAATALENARLYAQLQVKADEVERLRQFSDSVVESLSDGLVVVDLEDRVLRWNRRIESLIGLERGRAVGRRLTSLFEKNFLDAVMAARHETPAGATLYRVPLTSSHGGQKRSWLVNAGIAPFRTPDGLQAGWIIVLEDITDRANLEEQLRLSEKMAAIGLLAAGVAHEVNTPLTGISSFTQLLLERADPADPKTQLLEKIERQTFRAAKIVNSLLNMARPAAGEPVPIDLNGVIGDVLSLLEHQFRNCHIQVRKQLSPVPIIVRGEEYKLQQVFLNLFLNARDAMTKGGWLSISTEVDGSEAVVEVGDTGVGIPAEHVSRIYDPFFTTKTEGRGTGLGLSVTYGIVQEHGGTLTCDSQLGQGTRFRLSLPLATRSAADAAMR